MTDLMIQLTLIALGVASLASAALLLLIVLRSQAPAFEESNDLTGTRRYPLASMDGLNLGLTLGVGVFLGGILPLVGPAILGAVWFFFRPCRFELSGEGLRIVWHYTSTLIPFRQVVSWEMVSRDQVQARYGLGMRFGAGGFGGAFGQLICTKQTFTMYISRMDELVLIHLNGKNPLLISPHVPKVFIQELETRWTTARSHA